MGNGIPGEFLGTMVLILMGNGAVANVVLKKSKAEGAGWMVIVTGWALAVMTGVFTAIACGSEGHLNPAVTLGAAIVSGDFSKVPGYVGAQLAGAMIGACLVWLHHLPHGRETPDADSKCACFCTAPASRNRMANLLSEIIGTFVLVLVADAIFSRAVAAKGPAAGLGPYLVGSLVWGIGLSLGGTTRYAINPARDLGHARTSGTDLVVVRGTSVNSAIKLRALPEVASVVPVVVNVIDITPDINAVIYGWAEDSYELDPIVILRGRRFKADAPEIMLGEALAESVNKKVGDTMEIQGSTFTVTAIFRGVSAFETGGGLMPLSQSQRISGLGHNVTAFNLRLRPLTSGEDDETRTAKVRNRIQALLPGVKAVAAASMARNNQVVVLARSMAWGTSLIALLVAALGIANTTAMSVFERTKEIGILRALGWKCARVMRLILMESAILGLVGGVLGIVAGWGALRLLASIRITASIAQASIPFGHSIEALVSALLIGLAAGFLPAYRGAKLSPVEALRHD